MLLRRLAIVSLAVIAAAAGFARAAHGSAGTVAEPLRGGAGGRGRHGHAHAARPRAEVRPLRRGYAGHSRPAAALVGGFSGQARSSATATVARPAADRDENNIAILEDRGDLILRANPFDLANTGLRFEPAGAGYAVTTTGAEFRPALGRTLTLGDDDSAAQTIAFPFEFYGRRFTSLFVNSDGNLTFEEADNASTDARARPPRLGRAADCPVLCRPRSIGGRPHVLRQRPGRGDDHLVRRARLRPPADDHGAGRAVLERRHRIPVRRDGSRDSIVALSPGRAQTVTIVDLNRAGGQVTEPVPIGELFVASPSLDLVAASRRFYETHADNFDQLVFWTDTTVVTDAFAFESTVKNAITGTGLEVFDFSAELGSGGALQSVINMDRISKYPDAPATKIFGETSALGILAHETGHRWLARLMFRDANRSISDQLLGRQRAHWSFFMDSDGSVMEGNEIEDLGGGAFRTALVHREIQPSRSLRDGPGHRGRGAALVLHRRADLRIGTARIAPLAGITINGTRRDVLIQDVIAALGPRVPAAADSPRVHRQASCSCGGPPPCSARRISPRLARIREEFGPFFSRATENRMTVRTTLAP